MKGKKLKIKKKNKSDFLLAAFTVGLVIFGVVMVFSASYYSSIANDKIESLYIYLIESVKWAVAGIIAMIITSKIDYHIYYKFSKLILGVSIVLLIIVLTSAGHESHNAARWIKMGGITIMPGEIAKPAAIIFTSYFLSENPKRIKSFTKGIAPLFMLAGVLGFLIIKQPNLSTALTVVIIIIGIMFVANLNFTYVIGGISGIVALVFGLFHYFPESHWADRINSFTDPFAYSTGTGWQVVHSIYALSSGGIIGKGFGKSIEKKLWIPHAQNDFIFAIIGEEVGYIGCLILIIAYMVLIIRLFNAAFNAPDMFGGLLASGIAIMIAVQVIMNVAVVTSSMPATGVSLPFISYGGNSLLIFMSAIGVVMNISKQREELLS